MYAHLLSNSSLDEIFFFILMDKKILFEDFKSNTSTALAKSLS